MNINTILLFVLVGVIGVHSSSSLLEYTCTQLHELQDRLSPSPKQNSSLKFVVNQQVTAPGTPNVLITSVVIDSPPGDPGTPPHKHSGPVSVYIIEGEMLFQLKTGSTYGPMLRLKAGDGIYEDTGAVHVWGGNASNCTTLKFLATVFGDPNLPFLEILPNETRGNYGDALRQAKPLPPTPAPASG